LVYLLDVLGLDLDSATRDDDVPLEPLLALRERVRRVAQLSAVTAVGPPPASVARQGSAEPLHHDELLRDLLDSRRRIREARPWAVADEIRDQLAALGVIVEDQPGGESTWRIDR